MNNIVLHYNELNSIYGSIVPVTSSRAALADRIGDLFCYATDSFENDGHKTIVVENMDGDVIYRGKVIIGPENVLIKLKPQISVEQKEIFEDGGNYIVRGDDRGEKKSMAGAGRRTKRRAKKRPRDNKSISNRRSKRRSSISKRKQKRRKP